MATENFTDAELPASGLARPGSRVLLAGTAYHPAAPQLDVPAVARSVTDLAAVLRDKIGVRAENLREPLIDPSGPSALGQALDRVAPEASDTLLVYYAGHGLIGPNQELYLATSATDSLGDGLYNALPYRVLLESFQKSPAKTVVVMLDCCFSDRGRPPARLAIDAAFEQPLVHGGFLLTSAARDERALAPPGEEHTRFTGALIDLLHHGDPAGPPGLTLEHVYRFLHRELPDGTPRPHRHSTGVAGELVLAPNLAYPEPVEEPDDWRPGDPPPGAEAEPGSAPGAGPSCPYRGLQPFGPEAAEYFFGRDDLIEEVTRCVTGSDGLHAVIGPSGSGKTSLLRAGMVPELEKRNWKVAYMRPGGNPLDRLAELEEASSRPRVLLVVDQFEELFAAEVAEDDRQSFLDRLARLPAAVIALRADFYTHCLRYPKLVRTLQDNQVIVGPMSQDDLRLMIRKSAKAAGLRLESGLVNTLLRETRNQAAALPLLSHALQETWLRRTWNLLTLSGYWASGGIENAIGQAAQKIYNEMEADGQSRMRDLLLRMVRLGEDTEDTRRQLPLAELSAPDRRILDALARARLAVIGREEAELAHDAMLYAWPQLQEWIKEDRTALLAASQLEDAARSWEQAGGGNEYLYPGTRLNTVKNILEGAKTTLRLGESAQRFMNASWDRYRAELRAARSRRQRRRIVLSAICVLVLAAGTVGVISVQQHAAAVRHAAVIQSSDLAADAAAVRSTDPGLAAQLSVAAYRASPTESASTQLYASASAPVDSIVGSFGQRALAVTAQADGPLAAAASYGGQIRVWNIASGPKPVLQATVSVHMPAPVALAPRQPLLAAACPAGNALCLWYVAKRGAPAVAAQIPVARPGGLAGIGFSIAISPDGRLLALATPSGTLLYTIASPARPRPLAVIPPDGGLASSPSAVVFSPDSRLLAETGPAAPTKIWSLADPARPEQVTSIAAAGYQDVAFSPDGTLLAAVGNTSVMVWNIARPASPVSIPIGTSWVTDANTLEDLQTAAFTSDGRYLAVGAAPSGNGGLGLLALIDMSPASLVDPQEEVPLVVNTGFGNSSLTAAAGDTLLTTGYDGAVRQWRMPEPAAAGTEADLSDWGISGDGHLMAAPVLLNGGPNGTPAAGIWDISGQAPVLNATLPGDAAIVGFLGDTSDSLLTVGSAASVSLWNLADPRRPVRTATLGTVAAPYDTAEQMRQYVTSDAAGTLVAVLGADGRLHLWHVGKGLEVTAAGSIPVPDPTINQADLLPDGQHAVIRTDQGLQWWDVADAAHPVRIGSSPLATTGNGNAAAAGNFFATATQLSSCNCSTADIFRLSGRHVTSPAPLPGAAGDYLQVSDDGRLLASTGAGNNGLALWDLRDPGHPRELATLQTVPAIEGTAFSRNDALLVDWNVSTLQLWDLSDPASPALVASIAFQQQQTDDVTDNGVVFSAAFMPSDRTLAVSVNWSIVFLSTDPAAVASRLCSVTGAAITRAQWQLYAPGIPYQEPCPGS
jgi:WD40 repeat protein